MGQYTFSFLRSEYDRIPYQLKKDFYEILQDNDGDDANAAKLKSICESMEKAVADICKYAQDQLLIP